MDEIYNLVAEKTGLSKAQSKEVVDLVINIIKEKLPGPVASEIDNFIANNGSLLSEAENLFGDIVDGKK